MSYGAYSSPLPLRISQHFSRLDRSTGLIVQDYTTSAVGVGQKMSVVRSGSNGLMARVDVTPDRESFMVPRRVVVGHKSIPFIVKRRRIGQDGKIRVDKLIRYKSLPVYGTIYKRVWGPFPKKKYSYVPSRTPNPLSFTSYIQDDGVSQSGELVLFDINFAGNDTVSLTGNLTLPMTTAMRNYPIGYNFSDRGKLLDNSISSRMVGLQAAAIRTLYSRAQGDLPNYAQIIAERSKTTTSLIDAVVKVAKIVFAIKRGNLKAVGRELGIRDPKVLANNYLLWIYGVKPTIDDINGVFNDLKKSSQSGKIDFHSINAKAKEKFEQTTNISVSPFCQVKLVETYELTAKSQVRISQPLNLFANLQSRGLASPDLLAWELFPFSFVIDWCFSIGGYLANKGAFNAWHIDSYHETQVIRKRTTWTLTYGGDFVNPATGLGFTCTPLVISGKSEFIQVDRAVPASMPAMPAPVLKSPLSVLHAITSLALLTSLLSR